MWHTVNLDTERSFSTGPETPYALQGIICLPQGEEVKAGETLFCKTGYGR